MNDLKTITFETGNQEIKKIKIKLYTTINKANISEKSN